MEPQERLVAVLKADVGVHAQVADRVYPIALPRGTSFAPGSTELPALTYNLVTEKIPTAGIIRYPHYQVTVFAQSYAAVHAAAMAVRDALHGYEDAYIRASAYMDSRDMSDPDIGVFMVPIDIRLCFFEQPS